MIERKRVASILSYLFVFMVTSLGGCASDEDCAITDASADASSAPAVEESGAAPAKSVAVATPQEAPQETKQEAFVTANLARADKLIAAGRAEEARKAVLAALDVAPNHAAAKAKLTEVNAILGVSTDQQGVVQQVVEYKQQQREKKVIQVNDLLVRSQQLYSEGALKDALVKLELARMTMHYDGLGTNFGSLKPDVAAFTAQVQGAVEREAASREEQQYTDAISSLREEEEKDRQHRWELLRAYMTSAIDAFQRQDFDSSERLAQKAADVSPSFKKATDLIEFSRRAGHQQWREQQWERRREQMQTWKEQMRDAQIPWRDIITFPSASEWEAKTRMRRSNDPMTAQAKDSDQVGVLKNILENVRVTWDFSGDEKTLQEAVQNIRDTQNVNILISKTALEKSGDETVNFQVRDLKFADALRELLAPLNLVYTFRYDMIYVAGSEEAFGNVVPRVYEVRDLTINLTNFKPPTLKLRPGPAGEAAQAAIFGDVDEPTVETEPDQLLELVKQNVAPASWEVEGRDLQINSGQLVAVTTPEIHQQVYDFLEDLRRFTKVIVHVEARFISIREAFLNEVGVDFRGLGGTNPGTLALLDDVSNGPPGKASSGYDNNGVGLPGAASLAPSSGYFLSDPSRNYDIRGRSENIFNRILGNSLSATGGLSMGVTILDDTEVSMIFRAVEKTIHANQMAAPRLVIYNNQRANLTIVNQVAYLKDYDVEVAQTAFIADPLVDIIQDGLVLDVRPTVSFDRKYVTLEVRPTVATLQRPIRTFVTPLSGLTTAVIIELPEIEYKSAETTVKVPDNGYVVIGGLKNISSVDRRSETPILSQIPILSFFFSKKGRSDELSDLLIIMHVHIVDLNEEEAKVTQ